MCVCYIAAGDKQIILTQVMPLTSESESWPVTSWPTSLSCSSIRTMRLSAAQSDRNDDAIQTCSLKHVGQAYSQVQNQIHWVRWHYGFSGMESRHRAILNPESLRERRWISKYW